MINTVDFDERRVLHERVEYFRIFAFSIISADDHQCRNHILVKCISADL